jgi:hypothetical protein
MASKVAFFTVTSLIAIVPVSECSTPTLTVGSAAKPERIGNANITAITPVRRPTGTPENLCKEGRFTVLSSLKMLVS